MLFPLEPYDECRAVLPGYLQGSLDLFNKAVNELHAKGRCFLDLNPGGESYAVVADREGQGLLLMSCKLNHDYPVLSAGEGMLEGIGDDFVGCEAHGDCPVYVQVNILCPDVKGYVRPPVNAGEKFHKVLHVTGELEVRQVASQVEVLMEPGNRLYPVPAPLESLLELRILELPLLQGKKA